MKSVFGLVESSVYETGKLMRWSEKVFSTTYPLYFKIRQAFSRRKDGTFQQADRWTFGYKHGGSCPPY